LIKNSKKKDLGKEKMIICQINLTWQRSRKRRMSLATQGCTILIVANCRFRKLMKSATCTTALVLFARPTSREHPCRVEEYTFHERILISKKNINIRTDVIYGPL